MGGVVRGMMESWRGRVWVNEDGILIVGVCGEEDNIVGASEVIEGMIGV